MKKTVKIFMVSFTLSSFAIWAANELFFSVAPSKSTPVEIPQKNIALFFQGTETSFPALKAKAVQENRLGAITPAVEKNENNDNYDTLFDVPTTATEAISIASVEDVADIPLEYGTQQNLIKKLLPAKQEKTETKHVRTILPKIKTEEAEPIVKNQAETTITKTVLTETKEVKEESARVITETPSVSPKENVVTLAETDIIPFENNDIIRNDGHVEIVTHAPQSQIAMASDQISVDTLAIEQKDQKETPKKREWHHLEAEQDSPWVIAKANKYAKNSKAVEEYSSAEKEADIENLLAPKKIENEGEEIKTAEMVKNILIPIPEDIMNDKNLTPQLVSSKKTAPDYDDDFDDEPEIKTEEKDKPTLLKSITSIFSGSSKKKAEESVDTEEKETKKNKKGLFAAFSEDKAAVKILPAEMKLAFQPGRAEISGQTLRWIQAFANKAAEDPSIVLEIRIDKNSSYALQQRRLDMLHTILSSRGMDSAKINTVFTSREPNSFIIRTLRLSDNTNNKPAKNYQKKNANYQTW